MHDLRKIIQASILQRSANIKNMQRTSLVILVLLLCFAGRAQNLHVGVFGGISAYQGDLQEKMLPKKLTNGVIGFTANYELTERIFIRGGFNYSVLGGDDKFAKDSALIRRNLSFESSITELSLVAEYYVFDLYDQKFSPYVFGGIGLFYFKPYTYDNNRNRVFLQPLSTEGQGLPQYPDRKKYSLTQFVLPFGGGIKYAFSENVRLGLEFDMRKTFTDYLDDVSTSYPDINDLLQSKGQTAVDFSYRGDEIPGGDPNFPAKNIQRGGANHNDWYYFIGLHLTFRLGVSGGGNYISNKKKYGCPAVPQ
jgi:opacity protein-like surface antigen